MPRERWDALVAAMAVALAVATLVTLFWKVSLHAAVAGGTIAVLWRVFGPAALALTPLVGLLAWARVAVGAHSPSQVVAGIGLGTTIAALVFALLR